MIAHAAAPGHRVYEVSGSRPHVSGHYRENLGIVVIATSALEAAQAVTLRFPNLVIHNINVRGSEIVLVPYGITGVTK